MRAQSQTLKISAAGAFNRVQCPRAYVAINRGSYGFLEHFGSTPIRHVHVSALRSLNIFGYEPGSVKEVDHDFVEAVQQVRKEIPGFTF